jgi:hypothetical protein
MDKLWPVVLDKTGMQNNGAIELDKQMGFDASFRNNHPSDSLSNNMDSATLFSRVLS